MTDEIKKRIKLLGVKKSHVAKRAGLSSTQFSHYLSGRRGISEESLTIIKKYLGIK